MLKIKEEFSPVGPSKVRPRSLVPDDHVGGPFVGPRLLETELHDRAEGVAPRSGKSARIEINVFHQIDIDHARQDRRWLLGWRSD